MLTTYRISEIEDFDSFLNKLFSGLHIYRKRNPAFAFKLTFSKGIIELKTLNLGTHAN